MMISFDKDSSFDFIKPKKIDRSGLYKKIALVLVYPAWVALIVAAVSVAKMDVSWILDTSAELVIARTEILGWSVVVSGVSYFCILGV